MYIYKMVIETIKELRSFNMIKMATKEEVLS